MEDSLICTPPPPTQDFPFQEFPEFLNGDFAYHTLEIQSSLGI